MNDFEELWLVDEDEEANQLMKLGWKFIQVVYEDREMHAIKLPEFTCKRCGHGWIPRKPVVPTVCPKCKSPYWNKEREK